jgi:predicted phosphodiesterase
MMTAEPEIQVTKSLSTQSQGLLFVGDPHIEGRTPGFRKDNYPQSILAKLEWLTEYAFHQKLQLVFLGDLFDKPRDNPNWLISKLLDLFGGQSIPAIYGNHDCANPELDDNDSLTLLVKAGAICLLDATHLWEATMDGRRVVLGGSPYRHPIPDRFSIESAKVAECKLTIWLTHHDLVFPSVDEAAVTNLWEIPGIDYVINGHIHRRAATNVVRGVTTWVNPGNIARRSRSDAMRGHVPAAMRMDVDAEGQWLHWIEIPHQKAEDVFFDLGSLDEEESNPEQSSFVAGLARLQSRKTQSGAGLLEFLRDNVGQFDPEVANEILQLAEESLKEQAVKA